MVWHHHVKVKQNEWWFVTLVNQTVETNSSLVILFFFLSSVAIIMRYQAKQTYQKIWRRFSISFELWTKLTQQNENYRLIFIVRLHEHLVESMLNWLAHYLCFQRTDQMYRYSILLPNGNFKCKQNHEETKERMGKTKERKEESPKRFGVVEFRWQSINMLVVNSVGKKRRRTNKVNFGVFCSFPSFLVRIIWRVYVLDYKMTFNIHCTYIIRPPIWDKVFGKENSCTSLPDRAKDSKQPNAK